MASSAKSAQVFGPILSHSVCFMDQRRIGFIEELGANRWVPVFVSTSDISDFVEHGMAGVDPYSIDADGTHAVSCGLCGQWHYYGKRHVCPIRPPAAPPSHPDDDPGPSDSGPLEAALASLLRRRVWTCTPPLPPSP